MLKKDNRINSPVIFKEILKHGQKKEHQYFKIVFLKNNIKQSRFAVIVSSKNYRLAVQRNLIKRRMRNILKELIIDIPLGFDVLIFIKKDCLNLGFFDLKKQTREFLINTLQE